MNCIAINKNKQYFYHLEKGNHILKMGDDEIIVEVDIEKLIIVDKCYLYFFEDSTGFAYYRKYQVVNKLYIGYTPYCSIQSNKFNEIVEIDNLEKKISKSSTMVFVNNELKNSFSFYDSITIFDLRMMITDQFILINHPKDTTINLKAKGKYLIEEYKLSPVEINQLEIPKNVDCKELLIELKVFEPISKIERSSSLAMIAPMIMMAIASFAIGINSVYNNYLQGKESMDLIIPLILPSAMLLSIIFIRPLQYVFDKNMHTKKILKRHKEIENYLGIVDNEINRFIKYYTELNKKNFIFTQDIHKNQIFKSYLLNRKTYEELEVHVGYANLEGLVHYKGVPLETDKQYFDLFTNFKIRYNCIENQIQTLRFSNYKSVNTQNILVFEWILLQVCFYSQFDLVKVSLFTDDEFIHKRMEYIFYPHFKNKNKIQIYSRYSDNLVKNKDNSKDAKHIAFVINDNFIKDRSNEFDTVIYLNGNKSCDISIYDDANKLNLTNEVISTFRHNLMKMYSNNQIMSFNNYDLFSLYNNEIDIKSISMNWKCKNTYYNLCAPIGVSDEGNLLEIDLHENGDGPHIIIGSTTGGGKSEAIITILYSLAINYSPRYFQFAIIDFKGGGLADVFKYGDKLIPHCVGCLTNLDCMEMDRLMFSFRNESNRRQKLFKKMVSLTNEAPMNISKYQKLVDRGQNLPQLAHLVYIIDEFAELKQVEANFINELVRLARTGRSLGIHLILSTQKPAHVVDPQIWANCNTRICLKVQDSQDSKEMINSDDATYLSKPGEFYMLSHHRLTKGRFSLTSSPFHSNKLINTKILTQQLNVDRENTIYSKESQLNYLLKLMITKKYEISCLWQKSLEYFDMNTLNSELNEFGIIDDIENNTQYPLRFEFNTNYFIVSMNKKERIDCLCSLLSILIKNFNNQFEILIFDFDRDIPKGYYDNKFIRIIDNNSKAESFIKNILGKKKIKHNLITLILDFQRFFEGINQDYVLLENIISITKSRGDSFIILTNISLTIKYSLLSYFEKKISLSIDNESELFTLYDMNIPKPTIKNGFGYINEGKPKLFRFLKTNTILKTNKEIELNLIKLLDEKVTIRTGNKIILGIDLETMDEVELEQTDLLFVFSKYKYKHKEFIKKVFKYRIEYNIIDLDEFYVGDYCLEKKYVVGCTITTFTTSTVKERYAGFNCIWIGEGYNEQSIMNNSKWIKLMNNEAYYISKTNEYKLRLIDNYEE